MHKNNIICIYNNNLLMLIKKQLYNVTIQSKNYKLDFGRKTNNYRNS